MQQKGQDPWDPNGNNVRTQLAINMDPDDNDLRAQLATNILLVKQLQEDTAALKSMVGNNKVSNQGVNNIPMVKNIANPSHIHDRYNRPVNFEALRAGTIGHIMIATNSNNRDNLSCTINGGVICMHAQIPSSGGTPSTAREAGQSCQLGGNGPSGGGHGGFGGESDADEHQTDSDIREKGFILQRTHIGQSE